MRVNTSFFADDEGGNSVFIDAGSEITEIEDAGPAMSQENPSGIDPHTGKFTWEPGGWNVACRFTPHHKQWTEIITVDAVQLLKALEGRTP